MGRDQLTTAGKTSSKPRRGKASSSKTLTQRGNCLSNAGSRLRQSVVAVSLAKRWSGDKISTKLEHFPAGSRRAVTSNRRSIPSFISPQYKSTSHSCLTGAAQAQAVVALQRYCHLANLTESCHLHLHVAGGFSSREWGLLTMFTFRFVIRRLPHQPGREQII